MTKICKIEKTPASIGLTQTQLDVYNVIKDRHNSGRLTVRSDISAALNGLEKSWVLKTIKVLIQKKLVARYERRYYKLTTQGKQNANLPGKN